MDCIARNFEDYGLDQELVSFLYQLNFKGPTPLQHSLIPLMVKRDHDILMTGPNQSGKTIGYLLPIINEIIIQRRNERYDGFYRQPIGLVLMDRPSLVASVTKQVSVFGRRFGISIAKGEKRKAKSFPMYNCDLIIGNAHLFVKFISTISHCIPKLKYMVIDQATLFASGEGKEVLQKIYHVINAYGNTNIKSVFCSIDFRETAPILSHTFCGDNVVFVSAYQVIGNYQNTCKVLNDTNIGIRRNYQNINRLFDGFNIGMEKNISKVPNMWNPGMGKRNTNVIEFSNNSGGGTESIISKAQEPSRNSTVALKSEVKNGRFSNDDSVLMTNKKENFYENIDNIPVEYVVYNKLDIATVAEEIINIIFEENTKRFVMIFVEKIASALYLEAKLKQIFSKTIFLKKQSLNQNNDTKEFRIDNNVTSLVFIMLENININFYGLENRGVVLHFQLDPKMEKYKKRMGVFKNISNKISRSFIIDSEEKINILRGNSTE
uniref:ATP-dependent RNA helicase n=1 Tax=Parastrongyloides trichosuri TaxID=131310 RepID=A0A0N5A4Y4_PARTI